MLASLAKRAPLLCNNPSILTGCARSHLLRNCRFTPCLIRNYTIHDQDPLYIPFVTDLEREQASIMFWVSKNTNLKEVNVNIRVVYGQ